MARRTKAEAEQTRQYILDAARRVFRACGVSRSSLDEVAELAGVTRGAVYWHFQDKQDLFFAMRAQVALPLIDGPDPVLGDETQTDPLEGIRRALERLVQFVDDDARAREVLEIVRFRCEYVGQFASVFQAMLRSQERFRRQLEDAYRRAAAEGFLRNGLDPILLAKDTELFICGLIDRYLADAKGEVATAARRLIAAHVAMRRA